MLNKRIAFIAIIGCMAGLSARADAPNLAITSPGSITDFGSSTWNLGWSFTVNSPTTVYGLGNIDINLDAFGGTPQKVGLWDSTGTLLASVSVDGTGNLVGDWRFESITPVDLTVGQSYVLGGQGGAEYTGEAAATVDPSITYTADLYTVTILSDPLTEPVQSEGFNSATSAGWFGANMELSPTTPTPEPGTLALAGLGVAGFLAARRRK